jgi:hypothetical protein
MVDLPLFKTDAEVAKALGVTTQEFKDVVSKLEANRFPPKTDLYNRRRYWPTVIAFFDREYGLEKADTEPSRDGAENWGYPTKKRRKPPR